MEFSRPEYCNGAFPFSRRSSNLGIEPRSSALQADSLPAEPQGKPQRKHKNTEGSTRTLEWVAFLFSTRSSQPRDRTQVFCLAGRFFTSWAIRKAQEYEWVTYPFSSGYSQPRNRTEISCIAGGFFTSWATREDQKWKIWGKWKKKCKANFSFLPNRMLGKSLTFCRSVSPNIIRPKRLVEQQKFWTESGWPSSCGCVPYFFLW